MLIDVMICFMKRNVLTIILSLVIFTALAGCSDESATGALKEAETAPAIREVEDLPDADITIPSGLVGSEITDIMNQSSADYSGKDNGDGTITYSLSGADRKAIVNNISEEITSSIKDILDNDEYYPDITAITPSEDCTCFTIEDDIPTWSDFIPDGQNLEMIKSYMYMKVRLLFDPSASSTVMQSMNQAISEMEWRLNVSVDPGTK